MTPRLQATPARFPDEAGMPSALGGETIFFGGVNCYIAGHGPPMVLVHGVHAAPSAAEVRPVFEHYRATHTVFAIDLPGFGLSDRSDRRYDPRLMTDALHALAEQIRNRCGPMPIDALASSLGCEFLARAAVEEPARWGRLAFVSPTGLDGTQPRRGPPGSTRGRPWLHALLSAWPWSQAFYRLLTTPAMIRYFLQRTWGREAIDERLWGDDVLTARQPGARFAPLHFLSGGLSSRDIHRIYEGLSQPVWVSHGVRGSFRNFRGKRLVRDRGNWHTTVYLTGALPYFELPSAFFREFDAFLARKTPGRSAATSMRSQPQAAQA